LSAPPEAKASPRLLKVKQVASYLCAAILISTFDGTLTSIYGEAIRYSPLMYWSKLTSPFYYPKTTLPFSSSSFCFFAFSYKLYQKLEISTLLILWASKYILLAWLNASAYSSFISIIFWRYIWLSLVSCFTRLYNYYRKITLQDARHYCARHHFQP